jgi:hypothetical protein
MEKQLSQSNQSHDVSDAIVDESGGHQRKTLDPGAKRNITIIVGVVLATVAAVAFALVGMLRATHSGRQAQASSVPVQISDGRSTDAPLPPHEQKMLAQVQQGDAQRAQQQGQSYVPGQTNLGTPTQVAVASSPSASTLPAVTPMRQVPAQSQQGEAIPQDVMQGLRRQIPEILAAQQARVQVVNFQQGQGGASGQPQTPVAPKATASAAAAQIRKELVHTLSIYPVVTENAIDTSKTDYVSAKIVGGPLAGAFMIGTAKLKGDAVAIRFDQMSFDGRGYAIHGVGLDQKTSSNAINGNVDRHLLAKYVMPIVLAAAGGYATASAETGSTLVGIGTGVGTSTAVQTPSPTAQQARSAGLAAGLQLANQRISQIGNEPDTFTLPAGAPLGVLFKAPVYAK